MSPARCDHTPAHHSGERGYAAADSCNDECGGGCTQARLTQYVLPSRCSALASSMLFSDTRWPAVTRDVDLSARTVSATCLAVQLSTALRARTPDGGPTCQTGRKRLRCFCREALSQVTRRHTKCEASAPTWRL